MLVVHLSNLVRIFPTICPCKRNPATHQHSILPNLPEGNPTSEPAFDVLDSKCKTGTSLYENAILFYETMTFRDNFPTGRYFMYVQTLIQALILTLFTMSRSKRLEQASRFFLNQELAACGRNPCVSCNLIGCSSGRNSTIFDHGPES